MFKPISIAVLIVLLVNSGLCANILYIEPVVSPSHHIWNRAIGLELVERGHNVTTIGHDPEKSPVDNYTQLIFEDVYAKLSEIYNFASLVDQSTFASLKMMYDRAASACELDLNSQGFKILYDYPEDFKFDLIIFDVTVGQCLYPLVDRFGTPPVVAVTPFLLPSNLASAFGNHLQPSYIPFMAGDLTTDMTIWEKVVNYVLTYGDLLYNEYVVIPEHFKIAQKRFNGRIRDFLEMRRSFSMLLSNTDPVLDYPMSLAPNIIPVGGLHVKPAKALPMDLSEIIKNATHGVILFSLGSNIRSDRLEPRRRNALLRAFSRLPQIVLWKFEAESLDDLPANVVIRKWLPQNDILGHENTKLFICHGGALGTQEAIYHGVPMVGIPFYFDQRTNIAKVQQRGLGKFVDFNSLTENSTYSAITEVLNNDKYRENARNASMKYRDQPQAPLERAMFWIEYVLRHGGAQHLDLASRHLPFYKVANLDILAAMFVTLLLAVIIAKRCYKFVFRSYI